VPYSFSAGRCVLTILAASRVVVVVVQVLVVAAAAACALDRVAARATRAGRPLPPWLAAQADAWMFYLLYAAVAVSAATAVCLGRGVGVVLDGAQVRFPPLRTIPPKHTLSRVVLASRARPTRLSFCMYVPVCACVCLGVCSARRGRRCLTLCGASWRPWRWRLRRCEPLSSLSSPLEAMMEAPI